MASGGCDKSVDCRQTCSICLELYKGRHPKLLPCFHTFCTPCLTQLAQREAARTQARPRVSGTTQQDGGGSQEDTPVSITCPTCRTIIPIPQGGVSCLKTNFYIYDEQEKSSPQPLNCELCEEGEKARYSCNKCINYFCHRCRRIHAELCKSSVIRDMTASHGRGGLESAEERAEDEEKVVEEVLKKVAEEEKRLAQERRATEEDIHTHYTTLLSHAGEARDACLVSLREAAQAVGDALQKDASLAREMVNKIKTKKGGSSSEALTAVDRERLEGVLKRRGDRALLKCDISNSSSQTLCPSLHDFMSTVVVVTAGQDGQQTLAAVADVATGDGLQRSPGTSSLAEGRDASQSAPLDSTDLAGIQREMTAVKDVLVSLQQDNASIRDKNSVLCHENQQLRDDLSSVKSEQNKLQSEQNKLQSEQNKLQSEQNKLQSGQNKLQSEQNKLQSEHSKLQTDVDALHTDQTRIQSSFDGLQTDQTRIQSTVDSLKTQLSQDKAAQDKDLTALTGQLGSVSQQVTQLSQDKAAQDKDLTALTGQLGSVSQQVTQLSQDKAAQDKDLTALQEKLKTGEATVSTLETRLAKSSVQVAFHAWMSSPLTTSSQQTLICDEVISNVGGAYSSQTGIFRAPVTGLYCFMATSGPWSDDVKKKASLDIVVAGKDVGFLTACGRGISTGHTAVRVRAGQTVMLKTYESSWGRRNYVWRGTCFTGLLLQPDLYMLTV